MSDNLEARIAALEAEVKRLKELAESIKIADVDGDVNMQFGESAQGVSIYLGDVDGDAVVTIGGSSTGLSVTAGDVEEDLAVVASGPMSEVSIKTGDVSGDLVCRGEADVKVDGEEHED
jgi:hypothetical protein